MTCSTVHMQPTCGWVDEFGQVCGNVVTGETLITLHDRLIKGQVVVCAKHKAQYNRLAAELRNTTAKKRGK